MTKWVGLVLAVSAMIFAMMYAVECKQKYPTRPRENGPSQSNRGGIKHPQPQRHRPWISLDIEEQDDSERTQLEKLVKLEEQSEQCHLELAECRTELERYTGAPDFSEQN